MSQLTHQMKMIPPTDTYVHSVHKQQSQRIFSIILVRIDGIL